ncbi:hypothetical protein C7474_0594 [Microbacterium telephonicum]|uniref:Uncharacterized protein n=1 Tax=Microbacterium telephonicum TaxID=1714841 RepID=A0A498CKM6_9MICO|nr:hypothetical protein C7474_0594 [Microbacterium telephonicum]
MTGEPAVVPARGWAVLGRLHPDGAGIPETDDGLVVTGVPQTGVLPLLPSTPGGPHRASARSPRIPSRSITRPTSPRGVWMD